MARGRDEHAVIRVDDEAGDSVAFGVDEANGVRDVRIEEALSQREGFFQAIGQRSFCALFAKGEHVAQDGAPGIEHGQAEALSRMGKHFR